MNANEHYTTAYPYQCVLIGDAWHVVDMRTQEKVLPTLESVPHSVGSHAADRLNEAHGRGVPISSATLDDAFVYGYDDAAAAYTVSTSREARTEWYFTVANALERLDG